MTHPWTVGTLAAELRSGRTTSRALLEEALARIADESGEGARAYLKVYVQTARAEADYADALRRAGVIRSPVDGLPVSVKDLFDVGGDVTRAGSRLLADAAPAARDAPAVARLRAAGAVLVGRTNMVEFAFGGLGPNPHYGTPRNPWGRPSGAGGGRVPGGSSSGAGVAQADGMCVMALGSDTRGSVRIPAALCGVAGFKPTARRVPREGVFPLSTSLDSVGPLANSIACCAAYDAVLADEREAPFAAVPAEALTLMLPRCALLEGLDAEVARAFEAALGALARGGARIVETPMRVFDRQDEYFRSGGLAGVESYAVHRPYLARLDEYDPRVARRVAMGAELNVADYFELQKLRAEAVAEVARAAAPFDAMLLPTVPCVAPTLAEVAASDEAYVHWNLRVLRNTGIVNFFDGCAATLPCHAPGAAPVGLSVCGPALSDRRLLSVAAGIEAALEPLTRRAGARA